MDYEELRAFKEIEQKKIMTYQDWNTFHNQLMSRTVNIAVEKYQEEQGTLPASFAFFVMGSAARCEQSVITDQDHGIIYDGEVEKEPFLLLGKEIAVGLEYIGYPMCDGKVMASEPLWTNSIDGWHRQVKEWLEESSWESLRHFSTFFDSRVLVGNADFLSQIKQVAFLYLKRNPSTYMRLVDNVGFIRKSIGIFGQLLPERSGRRTGSIHLKTAAFFPYVNAIRLLALLNNCDQHSTTSRIAELKGTYPFLEEYEELFKQLLQFRFNHTKNNTDYDDVHYLSVHTLTKSEKQELKEYMKKGAQLFEIVKKEIKKECSIWE
ncbi:DUF294 nucleotidyltransferase-like domain-containing protein [Gracilibacillus marinus]|jgi:CBS domain-containing protein|uniref:DUF294 nucleotidyltransferase-like domain-containing protein n=1 Tax=Gracilibacillus marinus TaxID=630535 RepID=A0ABV8VU97_9BACI